MDVTDCVQKGGGTPLDSGDPRVLNAVFRGGSVWCAITTGHNFGSGNVAAVQLGDGTHRHGGQWKDHRHEGYRAEGWGRPLGAR